MTFKLKDLLATKTTERRTIKIIEYLKEHEETAEMWRETEKRENEKLIFRFNDLSETAKEKFARILKKDSGLWTVRKEEEYGGITKEQIIETLTILNPKIAENWGNKFSWGSFTRAKERNLSHLIYRANTRFSDLTQIESLFNKAKYY